MGDETDRALRERVKELECLYEVSRVLHRSDAGLEEALGAIAAILPRGFQYPELAGARVRAGSLDCRTPGFREDGLLLTARFGGGSRTEGAVEVSYPPEITARDPRPFLAEEGPLVERIAGEISLAVERIRAAEDKDRLESQLRHADRLATIGVLSAGIAHELNEPLAMILGFAQLVRKTAGLPEAAGRDISRIVEASLHAREILRGLLSFGRGDTTREEDCDVDGIVASVLGFLEPRCRAERVEVRRELSAGGLTIRADPTELRQVLVNLAVNAIQAMPGGGTLTVRTGMSEGSCHLSVEDTGIGMSRDVMDRIFTPFFTTKDAGRGTGLGLPVAHGIVTSLGGALSVESQPGRGSRFLVRLPHGGGARQ